MATADLLGRKPKPCDRAIVDQQVGIGQQRVQRIPVRRRRQRLAPVQIAEQRARLARFQRPGPAHRRRHLAAAQGAAAVRLDKDDAGAGIA